MAKKFTLTFSQDVDFDALTQKLTETGFGGALVVSCDDAPGNADAGCPAPSAAPATAAQNTETGQQAGTDAETKQAAA